MLTNEYCAVDTGSSSSCCNSWRNSIFTEQNNFYWRLLGRVKWIWIQSDLDTIKNTYNRATGTGKKINLIEKHLTKKPQKDFEHSVQAYDNNIDFCNRKNLTLPSCRDVLEEQIETTVYALYPTSKALDFELERAKKRYDEEYSLVSVAGEKLYSQRQEAVNVIKTIEGLVNSIACLNEHFLRTIQKHWMGQSLWH